MKSWPSILVNDDVQNCSIHENVASPKKMEAKEMLKYKQKISRLDAKVNEYCYDLELQKQCAMFREHYLLS